MPLELLQDYLYDGDDNKIKIFKNMRIHIVGIGDHSVIHNIALDSWALLDNDNNFSYTFPDSVKTIGELRQYYNLTKFKPLTGVKYEKYLTTGDVIRRIGYDAIINDFLIMRTTGNNFMLYNMFSMMAKDGIIRASCKGLSYKDISSAFSVDVNLYYLGNISSWRSERI